MKTEGIKRVFHAWNLIFQEHVEQLTALDSAGGDGDLGVCKTKIIVEEEVISSMRGW